MTNDLIKLESLARKIRRLTLESLAAAGSGHTGGSLGAADILTALYFGVMRHDPSRPAMEDRDRFILSIGHIAPVHYATLAAAGYFPEEELLTLRRLGSRLQGHPDRNHGLPGLELSAGSLGQGLSVATGMALAARHDQRNHHIFCLSGDGELQEGSIWEAAMSAAHHRLDNLTWIIDRNRLQIDGHTEKVMSLEPLKEKLQSFGWQVHQVNGNNINELQAVLDKKKITTGKPRVIIANTIMGKGVPEIENDHRWHGKAPDAKNLRIFLKYLT